MKELGTVGPKKERVLSRRLLLIIFGLVVLLGTTAGAAFAHYVRESGTLYGSSTWCTDAIDEISHGDTGTGYVRSWTLAKYRTNLGPAGDAHCSRGQDRPPGYLAIKTQVLKYNFATERWEVCAAHGEWQYNGHQTDRVGGDWNLPLSNWCGPGYYGTYGGHYLYNNEWLGGWLWSGYHFLPAT